MKRTFVVIMTCALFALSACGGGDSGTSSLTDSTLVIETTAGNMTVVVYPSLAPATVDNFMKYVRMGFYDGLIFHRVVPGFVIQTGGYDANMVKKSPMYPPVKNEADNGLLNKRGTMAMARQGPKDSATAQFFFNLKDNPAIDHHGETDETYGFCVFGRITDGIAVMDSVAAGETTNRLGYSNVPVEPVIIERIRVVDGAGTN